MGAIYSPQKVTQVTAPATIITTNFLFQAFLVATVCSLAASRPLRRSLAAPDNYCGLRWTDTAQCTSVVYPNGLDSECPPGETCYGGITSCSEVTLSSSKASALSGFCNWGPDGTAASSVCEGGAQDGEWCNSLQFANNQTSTRFEPRGTVLCGISDEIRAVSCKVKAPQMDAPLVTSVPFPVMPSKIHALIHKDWNELDPKGEEMMVSLKGIDAAIEFAHARSTFYEHLQGTFGILAAWDQPEVVRRTGLVHTAYSGDLFQFYLFDANSEQERAELRGILGESSEALTYLFGTINRGDLCGFKSVVNQTTPFATPPSGIQTVHHRIEGEWHMSEADAANILMVTIADYLDQMVETNGWRDHHQIEEGADVLYPGDGKPAVGFYWFSAVCNAIKDHLEIIPPIFNHCTEVLSVQDETEARDAYWSVLQHEKSLTEDEQTVLLYKSIQYNPYISEPHIMLSQIFFRQGHYYRAAVEARAALEKLYILASAWDKRRSYEYWVGFSRMLLLRANRKLEETPCHLPFADKDDPLYINYNDLKLTPLRVMVKEMKDREEELWTYHTFVHFT